MSNPITPTPTLELLQYGVIPGFETLFALVAITTAIILKLRKRQSNQSFLLLKLTKLR